MKGTWFTEELHPYYRKSLCIDTMLVDEQTKYQHLQVAQSHYFGNVLILDGIIQLTELDNAGYHEMITHIPMLAVEKPERVLIVGGGDGGSLQQVLSYSALQEVVVCELDRRVVEVCAEYFPQFNKPFDDPRVKLVIQDAFEYLKKAENKFDVIISDTTDPIGMAESLFSEEFYQLMWQTLTPGGAVATQCEQMFFDKDLIKKIYHVACGLSRNPAYYHALIPTYPGGGIGFMYMSDTSWTNGLNKTYPSAMDYLNPDIHRAAFALPEFFCRHIYG